MSNSIKDQISQSIVDSLRLEQGIKSFSYNDLSVQERSRYDRIVQKTFLGQIEVFQVEDGFFAACRKMPNRTMMMGTKVGIEQITESYEKSKERRKLHAFADSNEAVMDCYRDMKRRIHWLNREYTDHAKMVYFWMTQAEKIMTEAVPFTDAEWDQIIQNFRQHSKLNDLQFKVATEKSSEGYSIVGFADEIIAFLVVALRLGELAFLTAFSLIDMQEFDAIGSLDFINDRNALDEFTERTERTERLHAKFEADFELVFNLTLEDFEGFESQVWFGCPDGVDEALEFMNGLIESGMDYPDAEFKALTKYKKVTQDELSEAYNAQ